MNVPRVPIAPRLLCVLLLCLSSLASAADAEKPQPSGPPPKDRLFPAPLLHAPELTYTVQLLYPTPPKGDAVADARKLLAEKYKELAGTWKPGAPQPETEVRAIPPEDIDRPDEEMLSFFARRLTPDERKRLMGAKSATLLAFRVPFAKRNEALLAATRFAHQLASERGAFLFDAETREYFTPQSWKESRLDGWTGDAPSLQAHITMHVYDRGDGLRMITLGMAKFGLPDLVVEQVSRSLTNDVGSLVNAVAQLLAEGLELTPDGGLNVDLGRVKEAKAKSRFEARVTPGARRSVKLWALDGRRDDGDPQNPLLELFFPGTGTPNARQLAALDALFGKKADNLTPVPPGDPELAEVTRKALARLNALKPRIEKGLRAPEELLVKAGFRTDDGSTEHMWLVVSEWKKDRLYGTLANEPFEVSGLRMGSPVDVALSEVDDYVYVGPDGKKEGGESSRILQRREEGR